MAELSWLDALKFGGTSGVIAGIANQIFGFLRDAAGFRRSARANLDERQHQKAVHREAAHAGAAAEHLPKAQAVRRWVDYEHARKFGLEHDYHGTHKLRPALPDAAAVIGELEDISTGHPTKVVRSLAKRLRDEIDFAHNGIQGMESSEPDDSDFAKWTDLLDELIEAIHLPTD